MIVKNETIIGQCSIWLSNILDDMTLSNLFKNHPNENIVIHFESLGTELICKYELYTVTIIDCYETPIPPDDDLSVIINENWEVRLASEE